MIRLAGARKDYDGRAVLGPVHLEIERATRLAVIGPSGCGKSTLLRLLLGLVAADGGRVEVDGRPLDPEDLGDWRRRCGYVVQEGGLFPHLSARDNVELVARLRDWSDERRQARTAELGRLARLGPDLWERFPSELSGGQRQRVGLVRALFLDPDVLLLDEPFGALDPVTRLELQEDVAAMLATLSKTVLFVTHDLAEAAYVADELLLLRDGRVVQRGTPSDLATRPADPWVRRFVEAHRPPPGLTADGEKQ